MVVTGILTLAAGLIAGQFYHTFGIAPILGALLCAACFVRPKELWAIGLGGILLRDLMLGVSLFTLVRLGGIALVIGALLALKIRPNLRSLVTGLLVSSPIFHLSLAVGDWATGTCGIWPKTPQGLLASIVSVWPYFQRSFVGDVLFTSLFLSLYALAAYALLGRRVASDL